MVVGAQLKFRGQDVLQIQMAVLSQTPKVPGCLVAMTLHSGLIVFVERFEDLEPEWSNL